MFGFGLLAWYYSATFSSVSFDSDFIYVSRFRSASKIGIEKILDVKPCVFPIRIIHTNTYIVTITYTDLDRTKKFRFLSKGSFRNVGSIRGISDLDVLKQLVSEKKYGR